MGSIGHPNFRWCEHGEGEPVVLLHGLMGEIDNWQDSLGTLGRSCRPIALSLPLFDAALAEPSPPALAEYVRRFLDALDIPEAVVGGNSLGGHVALELALDHPGRVSGLILTGSSGLFERGFARGVPHRPSSEWIRGKMEEIFHEPSLVTPEWVDSVWRTIAERDAVLRLVRAARAAKRRNIEERLPEIEVPTLIVWGLDDRITPPEVAQRFHVLIPKSDLCWLSDCGHAPMLEQPARFNAIVEAWLARTRSRREQAVLVGSGER